MTTPIENLTRSADGLAEVLGHSLAAHDRGEIMSDHKIEHARRVILLWHQIKNKELARALSRVT